MAEAAEDTALQEDGIEKKSKYLLENKSKDELVKIVKRQLALLQKAKQKSDELKEKCSVLESEVESKEKCKQQMLGKIKSLEENILVMNCKNETIDIYKDGNLHKEKIEHLEEKRNTSMSVLNEKEEQIECLTLQLDTVKKTCHYLQDELNKMKEIENERDSFLDPVQNKNIANDKVNLSFLFKELNELKNKHSTCFEEKTLLSKIDEFKNHLTHFESERHQLLCEKKIAIEQITSLTNEIEVAKQNINSNKEISFLISDNQKLLSELNTTKEENEMLKEKITLLQNTSSQPDQTTIDRGINKTMDKIQKDYIEVQKVLFEMENHNSQLKKEKENLEEENHNIFLQLKQTITDKENLASKVVALSKDKNKLENQIKKLSGFSQEFSDFKMGYEHALLHGAEVGNFEDDINITQSEIPPICTENISVPIYDNINLTSGLDIATHEGGSFSDLNANLQIHEDIPAAEFMHVSNKQDNSITINDSVICNEKQLLSKKHSMCMDELKQMSDENDSLRQNLLEGNLNHKKSINCFDIGVNTDLKYLENYTPDTNEDRIKELEELMIYLKEENASLLKKLSDLEFVSSNYLKKHDVLLYDCNLLKDDLENCNKNIQMLNEENKHLKCTMINLEKQNLERSEELNCKIEEIKTINTDLELLVSTLREIATQQNNIDIQKLNAEQLDNLNCLKLFFDEFLRMFNSSNLIIKDLQSNLENLKNQKVELEEKLSHMEELNRFLEEEVKALQDEHRNSNYDSNYSCEKYDNFYKTKVGISELYSIEETNETEEKIMPIEVTDYVNVNVTSESEKNIENKKELESEIISLNDILKKNLNKIEVLSNELSLKKAEILKYSDMISEKEETIKEFQMKYQTVQAVASEMKSKIKQLQLDINKQHSDISIILKSEKADFLLISNLLLEKINNIDGDAFENNCAKQVLESLNNYFIGMSNDYSLWINSLDNMIKGSNFSSHVDKLEKTFREVFSCNTVTFQNSKVFFNIMEEYDTSKGKFITMLYKYFLEIENKMCSLKIQVNELESKISLKEEISLEKSQETNVKSQLTDTEIKFKKLKHISLKWKKELEDSKTMCSELILEKEKVAKKLNLLQAEREQCCTEHYHYAQNYQSLQTEYDNVQDELETQRRDFKTLQEEFNAMLLELSGSREKLSDTEEQVIKLKEMLDASVSAKKETERMYVDLEGQLIVANSKIEENCNKITELETALQEKKNDLQLTINENHNLKIQLDQVLKDESKKNLLDLEMADYERSVSELNTKLQNKETEIFQLKQQLCFEKEKIQSLYEEIESTEALKNTEEKRANDLKEALEKTKFELMSSKEQEVNLLTKVSSLQLQLEIFTQQEEHYKLQISESSSEIQMLKEKLKTSAENYQRITNSLESKISSQKQEISCSNKEIETIKQEFENYKIRVHSVLRQQKSTFPTIPVELDSKEKLENTIDKLKAQVKELSDKLTAVSLEHETLQEEYENLVQKYNKAMDGIEKKDSEWHLKLEKINTEKYQLRAMQEELSSQHLLQNEMLVSTYKKQIKIMSDEHKRAVAELQKQLEMADLEISRLHHDQQKSYPNSVSSQDIPLPFDILLQERQEGEGSECTDERSTPTYQMPLNTIPSTGFVSFEKLLQSPPESERSVNFKQCHECEKFNSDLNISNKKIDHLSEVLNESESTNLRMNEQIRVLKEEVRRLERNREREQHAENLEYLKNVILKFSTLNACAEKAMLIPVLTTMLKLSPAEQQQLKDIAGDIESTDASNGKWGSYLHRWSGIG